MEALFHCRRYFFVILHLDMTPVAKSVYYFSWYLLAAGLALFLFPNLILSIVGIPATDEVWPRVVGALTFILGVFFCHMARKNIVPFFFISLFGRGIFIVAIIILILFYNAPVALLLFAAVDLIGLIWTLSTYRR